MSLTESSHLSPFQDKPSSLPAWVPEAISHAVLFGLVAFVLVMKMVPAMIAGFIVYFAITFIAQLIARRTNNYTARAIAAIIVSLAVLSAMGGAIAALIIYSKSGFANLNQLLEKMSAIVLEAQSILPSSIAEMLPQDTLTLRSEVAHLIRANGHTLSVLGKEAATGIIHAFICMVIAAFIAVHSFLESTASRPLSRAFKIRFSNFSNAFRQVFLAQVKISSINTCFTGIYLFVILPSLGIELPFTKTMLIVTFIAGLIPVLGNLISNTVIFLISLGYSLIVALGSLMFLIVIHKFEYFLNAKIIGGRISATPWELLIAMLIMETIFGLFGMLTAPVLYAYLKAECRARNWI